MKKKHFSYSIIYKKQISDLLNKLNKKTQAIWAADCTEHVLPYFKEKYPNDNRPEKAIEAARAWARGQISIHKARCAAFASHVSAREIDDDSACNVARAAGHAAATAHVSGHAIHASTYATKAIAWAGNNISDERIWQFQHLNDLTIIFN